MLMPIPNRQHNIAYACPLSCCLTALAIFASAFHFWPLGKNPIWQLLAPSNTAVLIWLLLAVPLLLPRQHRKSVVALLPHSSVFAFLAVTGLSIAFSPNLARSLSVLFKQALILIGAFALFRCAFRHWTSIRLPIALASLTLTVTLIACFVSRFMLHSPSFGFHVNPHKYATFVAILAPMIVVYFLLGQSMRSKGLGMLLLVASVLSSGTIGLVCAILAGLLLAIILTPSLRSRLSLLIALFLTVGTAFVLLHTPFGSSLTADLLLSENDKINLKQRYIEWQAELNLLEKRASTGTGAGCLNDYRSEFYGRLPKLNTLNTFDQNGWLATAAETGLLGLLSLIWILTHYLSLTHQAFKQARALADNNSLRILLAVQASLFSAAVAHLFSSFFFNGILIAFIFVLALAAHVVDSHQEYVYE